MVVSFVGISLFGTFVSSGPQFHRVLGFVGPTLSIRNQGLKFFTFDTLKNTSHHHEYLYKKCRRWVSLSAMKRVQLLKCHLTPLLWVVWGAVTVSNEGSTRVNDFSPLFHGNSLFHFIPVHWINPEYINSSTSAPALRILRLAAQKVQVRRSHSRSC